MPPEADRPVSQPKRPRVGSEVVPSTTDPVPHHAKQCQDGTDKQDNDADRPDDRDLGDEPDDEKEYAENYHLTSRDWPLGVTK